MSSRSALVTGRRREQLRDFLRTRRARLAPADVGITTTGRRRTPGLRREEVAMLAGVGVSWYTSLEQGRDINVSPEVLDAPAAALGGGPELRRLLDTWAPPAVLRDRYWNLLAVNDAADVDDIAAAKPFDDVRLLPSFDQFVLGSGTKDSHIIPPKRRAQISKAASWISPIVVFKGRVAGTWDARDSILAVTLFAEGGRPPRQQIETEAERIGTYTGDALSVRISRE